LIQVTCVTECFMTHISDMDATQNVHADAATGNAVTGMFYDTHHRDMNAPQYVHTHEFSSYFYR